MPHVERRVFVVLDDVDLFAAQLADDRLHPRAFHAHTRADRVDVAILRPDRDLRAFAGIAGDADDQYGAVVDLRHFHLEQLFDEQFAGPRKRQLRSLPEPLHVDEHGADSIPRVVMLGARLFATGDDSLGSPEVEDHVAAIESFDLSGQQLADPIAVFPPHDFALGFFDLLVDDLLRRLRAMRVNGMSMPSSPFR